MDFPELSQGSNTQAQSVVNSAVPTVKIVFPESSTGWALIDKADFDSAQHDLYVEPKAPAGKATKADAETTTAK